MTGLNVVAMPAGLFASALENHPKKMGEIDNQIVPFQNIYTSAFV